MKKITLMTESWSDSVNNRVEIAAYCNDGIFPIELWPMNADMQSVIDLASINFIYNTLAACLERCSQKDGGYG